MFFYWIKSLDVETPNRLTWLITKNIYFFNGKPYFDGLGYALDRSKNGA
jgi:hypothetical protein